MSDPDYSPISTLAVVAAITGVATSSGLLVPEFTVLAIPAITGAVIARGSIRRYQLRGKRFANAAVALALAFAILTPLWHVLRFNSESLPGFHRVEFASMVDANQPESTVLIEKRVCLKGYALPTSQSTALQSFLFSSDGDSGKKDAAVVVQLPFHWSWQWQSGPIAVSGTLVRVSEQGGTLRYILKADCIRDAKTRFGLAARAPVAARTSGEGC